MSAITYDDIAAAVARTEGHIIHTHSEPSVTLSEITGADTILKFENLQFTASFKDRGAANRLLSLTPDEAARGVVAASAGNHAQGVALAASMLGIESTVFMPVGASIAKLAATRSYGARVELVGEVIDESLEEARRFADRTGAVLVHPFDHPDILRGQGTVGLEIAAQVPDAATVVVALGGGGLISGTAAALKGLRPDIRIVGVQAQQAAAWPGSLRQGRPMRIGSMSTLADGIAVGEPSDLTYAHVSALVDDVITVAESEISQAMLLCLERAKLVVEAAGAVPIAAILAHPEAFAPPVVAVLSGGNIDPLVLLHVTQHGLVSAGRFLSLKIDIPDRPGSLASLLTLIGGLGANVIDVVHSRVGSALRLGEVEVSLKLECRGHDHADHLIAEATAAGFTVHIEA